MAAAQEAWESVCTTLNYPPALFTSGWNLLQQLQATRDKLGDSSAQVVPRFTRSQIFRRTWGVGGGKGGVDASWV